MLEAVRGSIVLLRRFASEEPLGIDLTVWPENATFDIDVVPAPTLIAYQWRAIDSLLNLAPALCGERWVINFCSGAGWRRSSWHVAIHGIAALTSNLRSDSRLVRNHAAR